MAQDLGITRGSFYWHFKSRAELLEALLAYWEVALTDSVMLALNGDQGDARERLYLLMEDVFFNERSRYDMAFIAWAKEDDDVRKRVEAVLLRRRTFVTQLFRQMGFPPQEADARSRLIVELMFGKSLVRWKDTPRRLRALLRQQWTLLTEGAAEE